MSVRSRPALRVSPAFLSLSLISLACLAWPRAALASGGAAGTPAAATVASAADPMTLLKERLQEKLGAVRAPAATGTHEMQVPSKAPSPPPRPAGKSASNPDLLALVAAHRGDAPAASGIAAGPVPWAYGGEGGPASWGRLKPEYTLCEKGQRQSPIDIRDGIAVDLHPVQFDYRPSGFNVTDNGHTVQVNLAAGNSIVVTGRRYELVHFHFHRPSEERINGRQYDMSVHLVHRDPEGRLAVVAVVLERGGAQPVVQQVWNNLPLEKHLTVPAPNPLDPSDLLPSDRRYYTYMGSMTTPPCSEDVLWMVMQQPVPVSLQQVNIFSRLYPMNARPVQATAGRLIKQSN